MFMLRTAKFSVFLEQKLSIRGEFIEPPKAFQVPKEFSIAEASFGDGG